MLPMPARAALTGQQRAFIHYYLQHGIGAQAAREAGYKPDNAAHRAVQLLAREDIQLALSEARMAAEARARITVDAVLLALWRNHETAYERGKLDASNRALELIGKHLGMFPRELSIDARTQQVVISPELVAQLGIDGLRQLARGDVMLPEGDSRDGDIPDPLYIEHPSGIDSRDDAGLAADATET